MTESNPKLRLEAFSDAVFAIALTLLIIDIRIPSGTEINTTAEFWYALKQILPSICAFVLSFTIILITWYNHHNACMLISKSSPGLVYANGLLLIAVVFLPFPTALIGEYVLTDHAAPAVILYNSTIVIQSVGWYLSSGAALRDNLGKGEKANAEIRKNQKYGLYSLVFYSIFTILANWFPLTVAIITVLLWIVWLIIGIRIKSPEID